MSEYGRRADDSPGNDPNPLELLVAHAVGAALDRRFWQMTATAVVVAVITALLVTLPLTIWANSQTRDANRASATFNCQTLKATAKILGSGDPRDPELKRGGFLSTDAFLLQQQQLNARKITHLRPGALKQLLQDPQTTQLAQQSAALESSITAYWANVLIPRLQAAAVQSCLALG